MMRLSTVFGAFICIGVSQTTYAKLNVIGDFGGESAVRFYEALQPDESMVQAYPNSIPAMLSEADILPVVSHRMTPGQIQPVQINLPGMLPIFLIGTDNFSKNWLHRNYDYLRKIEAKGLVVSVSTIKELNELRQLAPELKLMPTPGDDLASRLNLAHYPALLTSEGLSQ
jgi:integrating conjugative element protein (TIGR03765 family)